MASMMSTTSRSDAAASQKASLSDKHQARKRPLKEVIDEDDDEHDESEAEDVDVIPEDVEDAALEASQEGSQGLTTDVQRKLDEMQASRQGRDKARKREVYESYDEAYLEIKVAITSHFDEHEAEASAAHEVQLARLKDLIEKKAQIEALMAEKLKELRDDYIHHSTAFESVIEYRLKKLG